MEDDLIFFINGRRPQLFNDWKTTLFFLEYGRQPQSLENGRKPVLFVKGIQPHFL